MVNPGRWALSPAYDLNPVPEIDRTRTPKTPIMENGGEPSMAAALDAAPRFGLKPTEAKKIVREVYSAVSGWRQTGKKLRMKSSTLEAYATAFEHPMMTEAQAFS
jgi:serine/threonine-protein kinase HipA